MELTSNQKEQLNNAIVILNSVFDENLTSQSFGSKVFDGPFNLTEPFSFAYEDNKAIGVAAFMGAKLMVKRKELTVSQAMECAVLKEYQGKKLGYGLAKTAIEFASKKGYSRIYLDSMKQHEKALKLYSSLGFKETGRYNDNDKAEVFMVKELKVEN